MGKILGAAIFKENGFTLAEVLITLGIIGVVAAMTIPTLMTHLNHIKLQSQFKEGYSLLAQAVKMYNEDEEATRSGLLGAEEFSKYFKGATICTSQDKNDPHCIGRTEQDNEGHVAVTNKDYKYTNYAKNTDYVRTEMFDDSQFYLNNGMLIIVDKNLWGKGKNQLISIDINGKSSKPNAAGHDLFTFELRPTEKSGGFELIPGGEQDTDFDNKDYFCSKNSDSPYNGIACAYWAMQDETYFKNLP